jgi:COP9 signalosome complex subunit 7
LGPGSKHLATLNLFAYDTIDEYNTNKAKYLALKPSQLKKLELLTIADMASKSRIVDYQEIMRKLAIQDIRLLEDTIIACMYNELLKGKLDQKNKKLHVQSTFGRDVKDSDIDAMIAKLQAWDN